MERFRGKVAIVTGGASGIGKAIVQEFIDEGAKVVFADINVEQGKALEVSMNENGQECRCAFFCGDVSKETTIKEMILYTKKKFGALDILVNNIGLFNGTGIMATEQEWYDCFQVNVLSHVLCIKHSVNELSVSGKGSVVNVASISGVIAQKNYLLYSTTKAALINMVRCLALDLAKYKIRVNNVCPGTVWSESNAYYISRDYGIDIVEANKHPDIGGKHPIGRVALPKEIARPVLFLASEDASFITGENLMVDGGYTIV